MFALILCDVDYVAEWVGTALNVTIGGEYFAEVAEEAIDAGRRAGLTLVLAAVKRAWSLTSWLVHAWMPQPLPSSSFSWPELHSMNFAEKHPHCELPLVAGS